MVPGVGLSVRRVPRWIWARAKCHEDSAWKYFVTDMLGPHRLVFGVMLPLAVYLVVPTVISTRGFHGFNVVQFSAMFDHKGSFLGSRE
jgi:hypothetical protein